MPTQLVHHRTAKGFRPRSSFPDRKSGTRIDESCFKYVPKLSSDVFCYESVCQVPKAEAAASAHPFTSLAQLQFLQFYNAFFGDNERGQLLLQFSTHFHRHPPPKLTMTRAAAAHHAPHCSPSQLRFRHNLVAMRFQSCLLCITCIIASQCFHHGRRR
jgi:hypothetical protein